MKYFIRRRRDCISSFCLQGERKKMEAEHKEKSFFLETIACVCVCVERMEGKCEDWVLEEKGGGKNVENVDSLSKIMEM